MLKMTKHMTVILVAIMLLAQIGVAQHYVVHFTDHGHYEYSYNEQGHDDHGHDNTHNDNDHEDHRNNSNENCQTCLIAKSLAFSLTGEQNNLSETVASGHSFLQGRNQVISRHQKTLYSPRAPPAFLL